MYGEEVSYSATDPKDDEIRAKLFFKYREPLRSELPMESRNESGFIVNFASALLLALLLS